MYIQKLKEVVDKMLTMDDVVSKCTIVADALKAEVLGNVLEVENLQNLDELVEDIVDTNVNTVSMYKSTSHNGKIIDSYGVTLTTASSECKFNDLSFTFTDEFEVLDDIGSAHSKLEFLRTGIKYVIREIIIGEVNNIVNPSNVKNDIDNEVTKIQEQGNQLLDVLKLISTTPNTVLGFHVTVCPKANGGYAISVDPE